MRALVPSGSGAASLAFADVAEPDPAEDQTLVAVAAVSVNRGETFLLERPRRGWRPGKDIAGTVIRAAANGRGPRAGDRVVAHLASGGWAERAAVPVSRLAAIPDDMAFEQAAALPLAGLTALRLARAAGHLGSRRVLLTGASGGVGHYFVELAAAQGAHVTAVTGSRKRGARLLELGAAQVIGHVEDAVAPFDVGLDSVGGPATASVLARLREEGLLIWFGQASRERPTLDFFDWRGGANATIRKFHYAAGDDAVDLATLVRLTSRDRVHPEIGLLEDWQHAAAAVSALLAREVRGNVVLSVSPDPT